MPDTKEPLEELAEQQDQMEQAQPKPRLPLKKIIVFAAIVCVGVGAAFGVTTLLGGGDEQQRGKNPASVADGGNEEQKPPEGEPAPDAFFSMEDIIVNLAGSQGRRFLKISMVFKLKSADTTSIIEARRVFLTDKLNILLSSKTIEQIDGGERKLELKREIRDEINNLLGVKDAVTEVLFTVFMVQ